VTTKAWLEGHQFDLQDLAELLAEGDVRVVHDEAEDAYYLTAPEIDNPPSGTTFYEAAEQLIGRINGLGRVGSADFRPVKLTGRYGTPNGDHIVVSAGTSEIRIRGSAAAVVIGPAGHPEPAPPLPWPGRFVLAATHPEVAEVLEIMGRAEPLGWIVLYKVHEIVRDAIKPDRIPDRGWATRADDSAFTSSANRADVSGAGARHARNPGTPPTRTMSLAEGRSFVSDLVAKWLGSLAGN
jgi:hypothetical protein